MTSRLHLRIINDPLVQNKTYRTLTLERMITILIRDGTCSDKDDAIRSLRAAGFEMANIVMLIDDARQAAFQHTVGVVAREMVKP